MKGLQISSATLDLFLCNLIGVAVYNNRAVIKPVNSNGFDFVILALEYLDRFRVKATQNRFEFRLVFVDVYLGFRSQNVFTRAEVCSVSTVHRINAFVYCERMNEGVVNDSDNKAYDKCNSEQHRNNSGYRLE